MPYGIECIVKNRFSEELDIDRLMLSKIGYRMKYSRFIQNLEAYLFHAQIVSLENQDGSFVLNPQHKHKLRH